MIDYFFPPMAGSGVQRTLGYVTHLEQFGWSPIVLTVRTGEHSSYDASLLRSIPSTVVVERTPSVEPVRFVKHLLRSLPRRGGTREANKADAAPVWRGASWTSRIDRWLLFPDRRIGWLPFALTRAAAVHRRATIDAIYSTSTYVTSHLIAYALNRFFGTPWVADFQDPWVESLVTRGHQKLGRRVERLILANADRVTFTTEPLRSLFERNHPTIPASKLTAIPMGFHPDAFTAIVPEPRSKFTITHFGSFYTDRSPRAFLEALAQCASSDSEFRRNVEVLFYGTFDAEVLRVTQALISTQNLTGIVRLEGTVPYKQGLTHLMSSDVLLLVTAPETGHALVPSKVYEYLAAGRPILALAPEGAVAQLIREANAGLIVGVDDVNGIRDSIATLYAKWSQGRLAFASDHRVAARYTWRRLSEQFASILDEALAAHHTVHEK
jgi:glycosyltransferase involved in cell wall biosynthesis